MWEKSGGMNQGLLSACKQVLMLHVYGREPEKARQKARFFHIAN